MYIITYTILAIFCLYLILKAFVKIKFRFWSAQPVFHIYDLHHWLRPNHIVESDVPNIDKYVNLIDIQTTAVSEMTSESVSEFCNFIKTYYLRNKGTEYLPEESHIMEYLKGSNHPSYVSIYRAPKLVSRFHTEEEKEINSVISARILHITIKGQSPFPIYYIDNLCVNPKMRKKGIAPKAIRTLYYELRRKNTKVNTYLFKREGEMTAIVPLTTFQCKGYDISCIEPMEIPHASMALIEVTAKNLHLLTDFVKMKGPNLDCVIVPELANLANIINSNSMAIYGILEAGKLIAVYVLRDSATSYDEHTSMEVVCSLSACPFKEIFVSGFSKAINICSEKWNCSKVLIEGLGDNNVLVEYVERREFKPFMTSPSAFFLYNYVSYSHQPDKCFIIC